MGWDWRLREDFLKEMNEEGDKNAALSSLENFTSFQLTGKEVSSDKQGKYILIDKGYYGEQKQEKVQ